METKDRTSRPVGLSSTRRVSAALVLAVTLAVIAGLAGGGVTATASGGQTFKIPQGRVENVRFERSSGGILTVYYDLRSDEPTAVFKVTLKVSPPGGKPTTATSVSGDVGSDIKPGVGKKIVWEANKDVESLLLDQFKFEVIAEAGPVTKVEEPPVAPPLPRPATLVVLSDPSGATVMIDGTVRGETPLTLGDVAPGKHRVQLTLPGYLERAQDVSLASGKSERVNVKLTRTAPEKPELTTQPAKVGSEASKKGGSPLKWVLPVAGGGAAVLAYVLLSGGSDEGGDELPPLCGAGFSVSPSITNAIGLAAATVYTFTASSQCTTLSWNFGDGATAQGATVSHTFNSAGSFAVSLSATNSAGTASTTQTLVVKSMTGTWQGTIAVIPTVAFTLTLTQSGSSITGSYSDNMGRQGTVSQSGVSDLRNVSLIISSANQKNIDFSGKCGDDMNSCPGTVANAYTATFTMTRQ